MILSIEIDFIYIVYLKLNKYTSLIYFNNYLNFDILK
jgi:hypothetical protein